MAMRSESGNKMKECAKYTGKIIIIMAAVILLFFCLQVIVFCIPEKYLMSNLADSYEVLDYEGMQWEYIFSYARGAQLDNRTDGVMLDRVVSEPDAEQYSVFYRAMDCNGYPRYWHGYLVFLKPLLLLLSYRQIRYLYMFLHIFFFVMVVLQLYQRFNKNIVFGWTLSFVMAYFTILPFSLQFSSVFFIMYAAMLVLDKKYEGYNLQKTGIFFLIIGMATSFFDFLTAPLITLGMPLIYLMLRQQRDYRDESCTKNLYSLLIAAVLWGVGYFVNWFCKWPLASLIMKQNIIMNGLSQGANRMEITEGKPILSRIGAIGLNLFAMFPPGITSEDIMWFLPVVAIGFVVMVGLFCKYHADRKILKEQIPFLLVMLYPYIWYVVVANHSFVHYIFTYRMQMITVWAVWIVLSNSIIIKRAAHS